MPFEWYHYIGRGTTAAPEILAQTDLPSAEGSEFWHILPCRYCGGSTWRYNLTVVFEQVLQDGGREPPTRPKGRPCKHEYELEDSQLDSIDSDHPARHLMLTSTTD